jgi:hypothetical protein
VIFHPLFNFIINKSYYRGFIDYMARKKNNTDSKNNTNNKNNSAKINNVNTKTGTTTTQDSETATTVGEKHTSNNGSMDGSFIGGSTEEETTGDGTGGYQPDFVAGASNYTRDYSAFESGAISDEDITGVLTSGNIGGIFGMPYQFLESVDRRIDGKQNSDKMGRKYASKIASHLPLLFLTPCRPKFMEGFTQDEKNTVLGELFTGGVTGGAATADDVSGDLEKSGRYYSTEFAFAEYYRCVNMMCSEVAYFCGIQNVSVPTPRGSKNIGDIDWAKDFRNDSFQDYFTAKDSVVLYVDGLTTVSDSFSNSTTESQIASSINGFSETAKELKFVLGTGSALAELQSFAESAATTVSTKLTEVLNGQELAGGLLADLASTGVSTIMNGGKLLFPKIWGDSTFSRSYSFDLKLRSPDHDSVSIFFNCLVPYIHLLALCMPQSVTRGAAAYSPNAYNTPFLLRAYAKGMFNINMGMITDLSVTRGGEAQWNDNGLPTQIDISITIEDLYNTLFITNPSSADNNVVSQIPGLGTGDITDVVGNIKALFNLDVVNNTEMVDFLANLAGLNIAAQPIDRKFRLQMYLTGATFKRAGSDLYNYFDNQVLNAISNLLGAI